MRGIVLLILLMGCAGDIQPAEVDTRGDFLPLEVKMKITSSAFLHEGNIPSKYTCDGENINPDIKIENFPKGTKTLVLIVDDPDAPSGNWDHWIVWNILPGDIDEDSMPGVQGMNDFKKQAWGGPCPPSGTHRYFFKIYALDTELVLADSSVKTAVEAAMEGHILDKAELIGKYTRA